MTYPYRRGRRGGSRKVVPLEKAKQIARERDRLVEEVEKLRRQKEEISSELQEARADRETLKERVARTESRVQELVEQLEAESDVEKTQKREDEVEDTELVARLKERLEKLHADLDRVRDKSERVADEARRNERMRLLAGLGDVVDSVERGLSMQPEGPVRDGLKAIRSQLLEFLSREGATLTGEVGKEMDPRLHEAIDVVDAPEFESGDIVEIARPGVLLEDGSVVLPAKVKVAA